MAFDQAGEVNVVGRKMDCKPSYTEVKDHFSSESYRSITGIENTWKNELLKKLEEQRLRKPKGDNSWEFFRIPSKWLKNGEMIKERFEMLDYIPPMRKRGKPLIIYQAITKVKKHLYLRRSGSYSIWKIPRPDDIPFVYQSDKVEITSPVSHDQSSPGSGNCQFVGQESQEQLVTHTEGQDESQEELVTNTKDQELYDVEVEIQTTKREQVNNGQAFDLNALINISRVNPLVWETLARVDPGILDKIADIPSNIWEKVVTVPLHVWDALGRIPEHVWGQLVKLPPCAWEYLTKISSEDKDTYLWNQSKENFPVHPPTEVSKAGGDFIVVRPSLNQESSVPLLPGFDFQLSQEFSAKPPPGLTVQPPPGFVVLPIPPPPVFIVPPIPPPPPGFTVPPIPSLSRFTVPSLPGSTVPPIPSLPGFNVTLPQGLSISGFTAAGQISSTPPISLEDGTKEPTSNGNGIPGTCDVAEPIVEYSTPNAIYTRRSTRSGAFLNLESLSPFTGDGIFADKPSTFLPITVWQSLSTPPPLQQGPPAFIQEEELIDWQEDMLALPRRWWSDDQTNISSIQVPSISANDILYHHHEDGTVIKLGQGSYGSVFLGELRLEGQSYLVAVKDFHQKMLHIEKIEKEAQILRYLEDTGFVPHLYGYLSMELSLVQECIGGGTTLQDILEVAVETTVPREVWASICLQLATGLAAFFKKGVLINDIKQDNILVNCSPTECLVKYIDMGLATFRQGRSFCGSPGYLGQFPHLAPEVTHRIETSPASDIYSLGIVYKAIMKRGQLPELGIVVDSCLARRPFKRPHIGHIVTDLYTLVIRPHS